MKNLLAAGFLLILSCNNSTQDNSINKEDSAIVEKDVTPTAAFFPGCYAWNINKDSAFLQLDISGSEVTGSLKYFMHEKDNNSGNLKGIVKDSIIDSYYSFQSEGQNSVREVVFKIQDQGLVEGYGDIIMNGDTAKFKNISTLQYHDDHVFNKTICR
jgi:hypothetical protein